MSDCYIYDMRSPKSDIIPDYFTDDFVYAYYVIEKVLGRYTENELIKATYLLDLKISVHLPYVPHPDKWVKFDGEVEYASGAHDIFIRNLGKQKTDVSKLLGLPDITWSDCYVLAALALLSFAYRYQKRLESEGVPELEICQTVGRYAVESSKYVAYAVVMQNGLLSDEYLLKGFKENGAKGGRARVSIYDDLKQTVFNLYMDKHSKISNRAASKRIYAELTVQDLTASDGRKLLTGDEPEKTIEKWIAKFKKESIL